MSSKCDRIESLIPQALEGELDEGARAKVALHARECPSCAQAHAFHSALLAALEKDPLASPPRIYFEGVLQEIRRRGLSRPAYARPRRRRVARPQNLASALSLALALIWGAAVVSPHLKFMEGSRESTPASFRSPSAIFANSTQSGPAFQPVRLAAVQGLGLISSASYILKMSPSLREELGLPREIIAASIGRRDKRG